jgi:acyl-CoA thioester hydrolase
MVLRVRALPFRHLHRVTYAECTLGNHVYYGRYLDLLEEARGEFFRHLGAPLLQWQEQDVIFPVVECRLRYQRPARYDDLLAIEVWLTALERVRLEFSYRIEDQCQREVLCASTLHACSGVDEKLKRIPEALARSLQPYLHRDEPASEAQRTPHSQ